MLKVSESYIRLKVGVEIRINYSKTKPNSIYLVGGNVPGIIEILDNHLISYKKLDNCDLKVYWHNWLEIVDLIENEWSV